MGAFNYLLIWCAMITQAITKEAIPAVLTERRSPLKDWEVKEFIKYVQNGSISSHAHRLCSAANLFCGNNVDQTYSGWYAIPSHGNHFAGRETGPYDDGFSVSNEWVDDRAESDGARRAPYGTEELVYFTEKDLTAAKTMKLPGFVYKPRVKRSFLPAALAEQIPLSTETFDELVTAFGIDRESFLGIHMRRVVESCERLPRSDVGVVGPMSCSQSLDAMMEFVKSSTGENARGLAAVGLDGIIGGAEADRHSSALEVLAVQNVSAGWGSHGSVLDCHELVFPYLLYGCHALESSKLFYVSLKNTDNGRVAKALAACHMDTSSFSPRHLAFQLLHSRPGHTEVCHWLPSGDIAWVPSV